MALPKWRSLSLFARYERWRPQKVDHSQGVESEPLSQQMVSEVTTSTKTELRLNRSPDFARRDRYFGDRSPNAADGLMLGRRLFFFNTNSATGSGQCRLRYPLTEPTQKTYYSYEIYIDGSIFRRVLKTNVNKMCSKGRTNYE